MPGRARPARFRPPRRRSGRGPSRHGRRRPAPRGATAPRPREVAQLRQGDAAQRQCRGIVTQGDAIQRAQRIARRQCPRRRGDVFIHPNSATFVTLGRPACPYLSRSPGVTCAGRYRSAIAMAAIAAMAATAMPVR